MIAPETAERANAAIWEAMVELAEAGHEEVVQSQAISDYAAAENVATLAADLSTLASAAAAVARYARRTQ